MTSIDDKATAIRDAIIEAMFQADKTGKVVEAIKLAPSAYYALHAAKFGTYVQIDINSYQRYMFGYEITEDRAVKDDPGFELVINPHANTLSLAPPG